MMAQGPFFLGIDTGTNSSKGILLDRDLCPVMEYSVPHEMKNPRPSWYEHDAEEDWWGDFCRISRYLIGESGIDPSLIACVGTSALGADCLPVDQELRPLRPAILYGIDARASEEIEELRSIFSDDPQMERVNAFNSSDIAPKIYWVRKREPQVYQNTWKFLTASSFITAKLCGNVVIDRFLSGCFAPLYSVPQEREEPYRYAEICRMDQLANIRESADIAGYITKRAALETGLAEGTPVLTGTDDSGAEAISAGIVRAGQLMIQMGSSLYMILGTEKKLEEDTLWSEDFICPGLYTLSGGTNAAGSLTKWYLDEIFPDVKEGSSNPYEMILRELEDIPPGSGGLITLPYFAGERVPVNDPQACGILFGLRLSHTRAHMYHSALESTAYSIAQQIRLMERHEEVCIDRIAATGGGAKNPLWLQIVADVTGKEIAVPEIITGAAFGDALMAALAVGHKNMKSYEDILPFIHDSAVYRPNKERHILYRRYQEIYDTLYESTCKQAHKLYALTT